MIKLFLLAFFTIVVLAWSVDRAVTSPVSREVLSQYQTCSEDSDCVIALNGCCDCANGGEDVAINKNSKDEFLELFSCKSVSCTERGRVPICGSGNPICNEGTCELVVGL